MNGRLVDANMRERLAHLGEQVLTGSQLSREEADSLFALETTADIFDLMSWANRIREHFKGNKIHLCSIINVKAGGCSENCSFCAQSSFYQTDSPKYGFVDPEPVLEAAEEASKNGVTALGLVAALIVVASGCKKSTPPAPPAALPSTGDELPKSNRSQSSSTFEPI